MSFLGGLFTGSNSTLTGDENNAGNISGFGTAVGEGDISNASGFYNDLLAGNPAETAKLLAPQISGITGRAQQQKNTLAQFGNRSGGNNSQAQTIDDSTRANIDDMVSKLTGEAAAGDASLGTSTLGLGLTANQDQAKLAQQQMENQQNSILGGAISSGVGLGLDYLEGQIPGIGGHASATPGVTPGSVAGLVDAGNATPLGIDDQLGDVGF